MKGIVFTEFLEMVEAQFGPEMADRIIVESNVPSGGAYTSVGNYDHTELVQLVVHLAAATSTPAPRLIHAFGRYLFGRFVVLFPEFFEGVGSAFELLRSVDSFVHVEVRKLDPNAELPRFDSEMVGDDRLELTYRSVRNFADLAEGLIDACIEHYGDPIELARAPLPATPDGSVPVRFTLVRQAAAAAA